MKTIFVSLFEGVESKNILRTGVVGQVLDERPDIRIVLLMKNAKRKAHYETEFAHPRLIFVVAPYDRSLGRGWDRVFGRLKFYLLRTETTHIRRFHAYKAKGSLLAFVLGEVLSFLLARKSIVVCVRTLDFLLVKNIAYKDLFDTYHPELVFLAHLFEEPEIHILREAKRRKVATIGLVNSWDKVTSRAIMRLLPDTILTFNSQVKEEMATHNYAKKDSIVVSGMPQYDIYFNRRSSLSREEFLKSINVPTDHRLLVFAPFGRAFNDSMWDVIDLLYADVRDGIWGEKVSLLIRFQPNDFLEEEELQKRPYLHYDYPGRRFSTKRGVDWDMSQKDIQHLTNTLAYLDVLVCYASSIAIDAIVFDKPVVNIAFEVREAPKHKQPTWHYQFEHYKKVLEFGAIAFSRTQNELREDVKEAFEQPLRHQTARKKLARSQCEYLDGGSSKRVVKVIMNNI